MDPLSQQVIKLEKTLGSSQEASIMAQGAKLYRQAAAQQASSDPVLAHDLSAVATDMQKLSSDYGSAGSTSAMQDDQEQYVLDLQALGQLCQSTVG